MLIIICFSVLVLVEAEFASDSEEEFENLSHAKRKYSDKWLKYKKLIADAAASYVECKTDCFVQQRRHDFRYWVNAGGIKEEHFLTARAAKFGEHYQIINHTLYRQEQVVFPSRNIGNEHFILQLLNQLPDMELLINTYDWPKVHTKTRPVPVFSFSKNDDYMDIMYPAWSFWAGGPSIKPYPVGIGRWDRFLESLTKEAGKWPWLKKVDQAFFRGSRTSSQRDPLVLLSREKPSLIDAQYTKNQAWKSDDDTLNQPAADVVTMEEHCKYKYLFNFRGVAASFRFKHLFLCGSLVFHVGNEWTEFFYQAMTPWYHYIPVSESLDDVEELLEFARTHSEVAAQIARRGNLFVKNNLRMDDILHYWLRILKRYASLSKWKTVRNYTLVKIMETNHHV